MKYKSLKILLFLTVLSILLPSCHDMRKDDRNAVLNLSGRKIELPDSLAFMIQDIPVEYDFSDADYKVLTYIDSKGCVTCRMKLMSWSDLVNEFKSIDGVDVNFLMILNTEVRDDIISGLKQNFFRHPVSFDSKGIFHYKNSLPSEHEYHTLLLDRDNRVIAVGNPVENPKIMDIYRQVLIENGTERTFELCARPVVALGVVNPGDTVSKQFTLVNNETRKMTIQTISPSWDCVSVTISSDIINPGDTAVITMNFIADSIPGYFSKYADIYYREKDSPEHLLVHGFIVNRIN